MLYFNHYLAKRAKESYRRMAKDFEKERRSEYQFSYSRYAPSARYFSPGKREEIRFKTQFALKDCDDSIGGIRENYIRGYITCHTQATMLALLTVIMVGSVIKTGHYYALLLYAAIMLWFALHSVRFFVGIRKQLTELYITHGHLEALNKAADYRGFSHVDIEKAIF